MRMENCPGGNDGNDNDDRGAEVVGGGNGDDDDNENDYNLAQVTGVMRRHGVDCASLARGVKVVKEIFLLQWKFYLKLPLKVVTSNRNPSHCTHSSHRYSETQDSLKLIDSLKLTGSLNIL